jgi:hypothetical protein
MGCVSLFFLLLRSQFWTPVPCTCPYSQRLVALLFPTCPPCSTTIVTDTPQQAQEVAFGSAQRQKVVSLDGTIINKAGIITGGIHPGLEARAGQWDTGAFEELKQVGQLYIERGGT